MLKNLLAYLKANKRNIKKHIRTNMTRPCKDSIHDKLVEARISYLKIRLFLSELHNLRLIGMFIIIFWFFRDFAFAAGTAADAAKETPATMWIVDIFNLAIGVLTFLMTPLIMLAGWLLSPDWTYGEVFGLREVFHKLWILVGNVVYVAFAFILIYMAFINIFSDKNKHFEIKQALPRLIVSILIVPFSWFIVSGVLSISNILTASVIRLPMDTLTSANAGKYIEEPVIPKIIVYNKNTTDYGTGTYQQNDIDSSGNTGNVNINGNFYASDCKTKTNCISIRQLLTNSSGGAYNLLTVYAYGIFKIQNFETIDPTEVKGINSIIDIAKKGGFGVIFFVMFAILLVAIIFALFSRVAKLWVYAIFSPLFALAYFFKGAGGKAEEMLKKNKFSIGGFVSLALVPVYVSAALAFGLMFLSATMSQGIGANSQSLTSDIVKISEEGSGDNAKQTFKFGEVSFTTVGVLSKKTESIAGSVLDTGKGIIGTIIINFLALAVLWMAVMAALGADEITKAAVQPFEKMGTDIGGLIKDLPKYTPIPLPGGKSMSAMGASTLTGQAKSTIEQMGIAGATEAGTRFGTGIGRSLGMRSTEELAALSKLDSRLAGIDLAGKAKQNPLELAKDLKEAITGMGVDSKKAIEDATIRKGIVDKLAIAYGLDDAKKSLLMSAGSEDLFNKKFQEVAKGNHAMEMLIDSSPGINASDKFTEIFKGAKETLTKDIKISGSHLAGGKAAGTDQKITIELADGKMKPITFDKATEITLTKVELKGDDKKALGEILKGLDKDKAISTLGNIFDSSQVDLEKLYAEIIK